MQDRHDFLHDGVRGPTYTMIFRLRVDCDGLDGGGGGLKKDRRKKEATSRNAGPFRTGFLSRSSRARRRRRPWEARAICIPNDRMTFARCIKMPLIDGARENTFFRLVLRSVAR